MLPDVFYDYCDYADYFSIDIVCHNVSYLYLMRTTVYDFLRAPNSLKQIS